jgi:hypothetical protein
MAQAPETEKLCPVCSRTFGGGVTFCPHDGTRLIGEETDGLEGRVIDGRFTVTGFLGKGGMGAVYVALQHSMSREVALKVLKSEYARNVDVVKRFLHEARAASRLTNPHTISLFDFGRTEDGILYIAMERLRGESLADVLARDGAFPEKRAEAIAVQLCESLAEAHAMQLVHRDVKPENVFLLNPGTPREFVKVLDFGIAKSFADPNETQLTRTGMVCGTPEYMSPEHASGKGATPASDVYSVGVLLYQMLCGGTPFHAESPMEVLVKQIHDQPEPIRARMGERPLSGPMERLVERCLSKRPEARPQDANQLLQALLALEGERLAGHQADTVLAGEAAAGAGAVEGQPRRAGASSTDEAEADEGMESQAAAGPGTLEALRAVKPATWVRVAWGVGIVCLALALGLWVTKGGSARGPIPVPEAVPVAVPGPETVPETVPVTVPETVPVTVPETVPETVTETVPVEIPETAAPRVAPKPAPKPVPKPAPRLAPRPEPKIAPGPVPEPAPRPAAGPSDSDALRKAGEDGLK